MVVWNDKNRQKLYKEMREASTDDLMNWNISCFIGKNNITITKEMCIHRQKSKMFRCPKKCQYRLK